MDQGGERPQDPKNDYGNPLKPEGLPIVSMGIYFGSTTVDITGEAF